MKTFMKRLILFCFCLVMLGTAPKIVLGYIDRMNPAIILLDGLDKEIVVAVEAMPDGSAEGVWVDIEVGRDEDEVIRVNKELTLQKEAKAMNLQRKLQQQTDYPR